jgi:RNA ligase (TIGR02306 family)
MNLDRKLATVRRVNEIRPIIDADNIELAVVDGWQVVVKKGEFHVGNTAVYFEIDSWIPIELAPFLRKPGHPERIFEGVDGERLRTIRLRGQISQGLLLPTAPYGAPNDGEDLTERLNIKKWEKPIPTQLAGTVKGTFPTFLRRTDQERIQNKYKDLRANTDLFEITEKLDGSSMTVYHRPDVDGQPQSGVCSRNLELKPDPANAFWSVVLRDDIIYKLMVLVTPLGLGRSLALQGELVGPGVQGNSYKLERLEFYVFDIFDIDTQEYLDAGERGRIVHEMGLNHVPPYGWGAINKVNALTQSVKEMTLQMLLDQADGPSMINSSARREGLVYKSTQEPSNSFKVISNEWLLKEKE